MTATDPATRTTPASRDARAPFRGPFADGPAPSSLRVHSPPIHTFGFGELRRLLSIALVIAVALARAVPPIVARRKPPSQGFADALARAFETLGPTFVKVGQLITSAPGVFPAPLTNAFASCLDDVPPIDLEAVHRTIEEDLGEPATRVFRSFDDVPLSAASIAQVHACVLPDGRDAVVKVQRPAIAERMNTDLRIMYRLARLISRHPRAARMNAVAIVEDLHLVTNQELNFALEAHRQTRFRDHLHHFGDNLAVTAPEVHWNWCGPRVVCMERMHGQAIDNVAAQVEDDLEPELVLRRAMKAWMEAVCVHGPFHGDMHAGNLWLLDDRRVCFLDFGIMGDLPVAWRQLFTDVFETGMVDNDFTRIARAFKTVGVIADAAGSVDEVAASLGPLLESSMGQSMGEISIGESMKATLDMFELLGAVVPREMVLVSKQLLYFEGYAKALAPDYDMSSDLYLGRNLFPDAVTRKVAELGVTLPD